MRYSILFSERIVAALVRLLAKDDAVWERAKSRSGSTIVDLCPNAACRQGATDEASTNQTEVLL